MNKQRENNESLETYKLRLYTNKNELNLTWEDIADLLNVEFGTDYTEAKYRREYKKIKSNTPEITKVFKNDTSKEIIKKAQERFITEYDKKILELKKERNKRNLAQRDINKWLRETAQNETLQDKVIDAISNLKPITIEPIEIKSNFKNNILTVDVADIHYGRITEIKGLNDEIISEYNPEIFKKRMSKLLYHIGEKANDYDVEKIIVLNLGDSIDGLLRASQLTQIKFGVVQQTMEFAEYFSTWLEKLQTYTKRNIELYSAVGNHSENRPLNTQRGELPKENMEYIISWFIKERLKDNEYVIIHEPKEFQVINIYDLNMGITHGQYERNLEDSIHKYSMIYGVDIHLLKTGHLHHLSTKVVGAMNKKNIEYVQSPSICSFDEYALNLKKLSNAGSLISIHRKENGVIANYPINLE